MTGELGRREFIKLAGLISLGLISSPGPRINDIVKSNGNLKNILVVVLDALSAYHITLYGYSRETMPNLTELASKSIVYHNHYASGNFTVPGTASLLTGVLPWTHHALKHNDVLADDFVNHNLFSSFPEYYRVAYSHNGWVNTLLKQLNSSIDELIPQGNLFLANDEIIDLLFQKDEDIASLSWNRAFKQKDDGISYSLFLSQLYQNRKEEITKNVFHNFPRGIPNTNTDNYFLLEKAVDFLNAYLQNIPSPFLGYFHFLPPHDPYNTRKDFFGRFEGDGYVSVEKPKHVFSGSRSQDQLDRLRTYYDEFILYADASFAEFFDYLDHSGVLKNSILVLTSDHGELFERGNWGHITSVLHQPIVRVPLVIFDPENEDRINIYDNTSAIDLLPTLLHISDKNIPGWIEGKILPPWNEKSPKTERQIFAFQSRYAEKDQPYQEGTAMVVHGRYKLIYYFGYDDLESAGELVEFYDIQEDPEELVNLYTPENGIAKELLIVLMKKLGMVSN